MNRTIHGVAAAAVAGVSIAAALPGAASAASHAGPGVAVTDLGTLGGPSVAVEVNDSGQVVGKVVLVP